MYLSLSNFPAVGLQAHVASLGCLRPFPQRAVETNIPLAVAYVNISGPSAHDKRMNDCLPPILFSAIFKLLKVLPDTELDAC